MDIVPGVEYDPEADALYFRVGRLPVAYTKHLDHARNIDYAANDEPTGIELLDVSQGITLDDLPAHDALMGMIRDLRRKGVNVEILSDEIMLFDEDNLYFDEHADDLIQRYPDEWVAIYQKQVVGRNASVQALVDDLTEKDLPVGQVAIRRATRDHPLFL